MRTGTACPPAGAEVGDISWSRLARGATAPQAPPVPDCERRRDQFRAHKYCGRDSTLSTLRKSGSTSERSNLREAVRVGWQGSEWPANQVVGHLSDSGSSRNGRRSGCLADGGPRRTAVPELTPGTGALRIRGAASRAQFAELRDGLCGHPICCRCSHGRKVLSRVRQTGWCEEKGTVQAKNPSRYAILGDYTRRRATGARNFGLVTGAGNLVRQNDRARPFVNSVFGQRQCDSRVWFFGDERNAPTE